ncbi:MAG: rhodanese-like domain-containing protein [Candidatus Babeliaceae bacterium]|nr:rhodanese-like domain-containing protein [Candidatus Babeliaceae bacterium]
MKKLLVSAACLLVLSGCFWNRQETTSNSENSSMLYVVNVLSKDIYNDAHIKGSLHIDLDDLQMYADKWDKNTPVVFYCSNYQCSASGHAAKVFKQAGFKQVYAYEGGAAEWFQLGYPMEGPQTEEISGYLKQAVQAPDHVQQNIDVITASQLKDMMTQAGLL